ncbi:MAG: hypothetical protein FWG03_04555 [Clostridiales bacterium]|nr:hypothetical protein [Clostridiales bacterium]
MSQSQLLIDTIEALEKAGCEYMLTGSIVSSMQGEPRATHDIDIVVEVSRDILEVFFGEFSTDDYYYDPEGAKAAIEAKDMFNLLSIASGDKVDIWALTESAFDQSRFARRQTVDLLGKAIKVSSPEDTIIMKLLWAKMSGGSEKQLFDAARVYDMQSDSLDHGYIITWINILELETQFADMQRFV